MSKPRMIYFPNQEAFVGKVFFLPFNRDASAKKILAEKMKKHGFTQAIMLIKTDLIDGVMKIYVADGQHRALTAISMNLAFRGELLPNTFDTREALVMFVADHNNSQKPWSVTDYVKSFASVGLIEYINLIDIKKKSIFTFLTLATMLGSTNSRSISDPLKNGKFKICRKKETLKTLEYANELMKYKPLTNRMVISLHRVMSMSIFSKKKFTKAYENYASQLAKLHLDTFDDTFISWLK